MQSLQLKNLTNLSKSIKEFQSEDNFNYLQAGLNSKQLPLIEINHMQEIEEILLRFFARVEFRCTNSFLSTCYLQLHPATLDLVHFYSLYTQEYKNQTIYIQLLNQVLLAEPQTLPRHIHYPESTSTMRTCLGPVEYAVFVSVTKLQAVDALKRVLERAQRFPEVSHCSKTGKVMAVGRSLLSSSVDTFQVLEAHKEFGAFRFTLVDAALAENRSISFMFEYKDGHLQFNQTVSNDEFAQNSLATCFELYRDSAVPAVFSYIQIHPTVNNEYSITLIPSLRYPSTAVSKETYNKTSQILQKISLSNFLRCNISQVEMQLEDLQTYKHQDEEEDVLLRLVWNVPLNPNQVDQFQRNITRINKHMFKQSKLKYLQVFNQLLQADPKAQRIATSQISQMMVKNQQMLELQLPQLIPCHQVNDFVRSHFFELTQENQGVIFVYMQLKYCQRPADQPLVNTLLSETSLVSLMETNYNTIELYKTLVYFGQPDTILFPRQTAFFTYIHDNLLELQDNIVYKEMLLFVFKQCHSRDVDSLVRKLAENVNVFFENIQGINILKAIQELHCSCPAFPFLQECVGRQLDYILTTRQLNQLYFQFLERDLYCQYDKALLVNCDDASLRQMIDLLQTSVGFNSVNALLAKYGWTLARPKFEAILQYLIQQGAKKSNVVLRSVQKIIQKQENPKSNFQIQNSK